MRVRLLGTAAGGGFPQWNCHCRNCRLVRIGDTRVQPRWQSCVALTADDRHWFLLNASPDVRVQLESFPPLLRSPGVRGSPLEGILLANADLDHTLGLFSLREGSPLRVYATAAIQNALIRDLNLPSVLGNYCGLEWQEPADQLTPLFCADGSPSGLSYAMFPLSAKPPRYASEDFHVPGSDWHCIGYIFVDDGSGRRLFFAPEIAELNGSILNRMGQCDALLLDGTFWSDDEMQVQKTGQLSARQMGHLPVGGPDGSLAQIEWLTAQRKIYVHLNNTNPMLMTGSPQHKTVLASGAEVGRDGLELEL